MEYELSTIKDIFDKVPWERVETCMQELTILIRQAQATAGLVNAVADEVVGKQAIKYFEFPDKIIWNDDDKGNLTINVTMGNEKLMTVDMKMKKGRKKE